VRTYPLDVISAPTDQTLASEGALARAALALGAAQVAGWSPAEAALAAAAGGCDPPPAALTAIRAAVSEGRDPLGRAFCALRSAERRRPDGATYTPPAIVDAMVAWAAERPAPARIVDPGAGSGRFAVAAGRRFPRARIVAVERDPLAAMTCRAHLAAAGLADRATVLVDDYRTADLGAADGRTLYLGNPPYVRHHQIAAGGKEWLTLTARAHGFEASQLAGLHVHFFLATAVRARPGDGGALVTSSEWLDTNYGGLVRELLLGPLGGESIHVLEPTAVPFDDAAVTAAITCFSAAGRRPAAIRMRRVDGVSELDALSGGRPVPADVLRESRRWTPLRRARCRRTTSSSGRSAACTAGR
jgi:adenine-specific DNA-methyltransferase